MKGLLPVVVEQRIHNVVEGSRLGGGEEVTADLINRLAQFSILLVVLLRIVAAEQKRVVQSRHEQGGE